MIQQIKYKKDYSLFFNYHKKECKIIKYNINIINIFILISILLIYNTNHNLQQILMKNLKSQGLKRGITVSSNKQNQIGLCKERASSFSIRITDNNEKNLSNSQTTKCSTSNKVLPPLSSIKPEKKSFENQRKPSLTIKQQKPSLCLQKNYNRTISKKIQVTQDELNMSRDFQKLIKLLENNFIISQKHSNIFLIKKQDLSKLLQNCLLYKTSLQKPEFLQNSQQFNNLLLKIYQTAEQQKKRDKKSKLNIIQTVYDNYSSKDYNKDILCQKQKISVLLDYIQELQRKIGEIQLHLKDLLIRKQYISKVIDQKQITINNLQAKLKIMHLDISQLQTITQQKKQFLSKMQKEYNEIINFVSNQNKNKHVKMASDDYKLIEADIYDYAAYLQANQLASGMTYEHIPIVCYTHDLDQKIASFNKMLVQNQELSIKEKGRKLRDFLTQVVQKYRKKDIQVEKLMGFKTKCIVKFIDQMKKWLNNWELKQEYLKNLRLQHIYNHDKMINLFEQIDTTILCKPCRQQIFPRKKMLLQMYMKMDQNYKMGNSFY